MMTTTTTEYTTTTATRPAVRKPLIAGVLRTTLPPHGFSNAEREEVHRAFGEGRDVRERTMDHVVDRLLKELTW
jgi:hypothetical protein